MKFRETVKYHNAVEYTQIFVDMSPAKFKERYGMTFNEWKDGLPDGDYRKNFKFNECYVMMILTIWIFLVKQRLSLRIRQNSFTNLVLTLHTKFKEIT